MQAAAARFCRIARAARGPGRHHQAVPGESLRQQPPRPCQPPCHRPFGADELLSGFLAGLAFQIAKDDDTTILVRQAAQRCVEEGLQILPEVSIGHGWFGHHRHLPFPLHPSGRCRPRLQRRLVCHPVEPVCQQIPQSKRSRLANEDKEGSLKASFMRRGSGRTRRHTPQTIGAWRRTRAARAASSRRLR